MEFRIAPFIILAMGIVLQIIILPELHDSADLLEQGQKMIITASIILVLALSSYFRHHFYPRSSQIAFYAMLLLYISLFTKYIYQYINF